MTPKKVALVGSMKFRLTSRLAVRKREPAQHHAVDDAEHRRDAGNAQREHDHGKGAEPFLLDQDPEADLDVAEQGVVEHGFVLYTGIHFCVT